VAKVDIACTVTMTDGIVDVTVVVGVGRDKQSHAVVRREQVKLSKPSGAPAQSVGVLLRFWSISRFLATGVVQVLTVVVLSRSAPVDEPVRKRVPVSYVVDEVTIVLVGAVTVKVPSTAPSVTLVVRCHSIDRRRDGYASCCCVDCRCRNM
jgi:hypothetical protein